MHCWTCQRWIERWHSRSKQRRILRFWMWCSYNLRQELFSGSRIKCACHSVSLAVDSVMMVVLIYSSFKPCISSAAYRWSWARSVLIFSSLSFTNDLSSFVSIIHKWLQCGIRFIKVFLSLFLADAIFEAGDLIELADCAAVQFIHTLECFLTKSLLIICKEKTSELLSLEEILAMVLMLWHCQNFCTIRGFVCFWWGILSSHIYFPLWILRRRPSVLVQFRWYNIMSLRDSSVVANWFSLLKYVSLFSTLARLQWCFKTITFLKCRLIISICSIHHITESLHNILIVLLT
jgi:hypothetical protein